MNTDLNDLQFNAVFQNGIKNADFVVFNPLNIEFTNEKPLFQKIILNPSDFWNKIKSIVWSASCRFFFVVNETTIIVGNSYSDEAFSCNLTGQVFEEYVNYFSRSIK